MPSIYKGQYIERLPNGTIQWIVVHRLDGSEHRLFEDQYIMAGCEPGIRSLPEKAAYLPVPKPPAIQIVAAQKLKGQEPTSSKEDDALLKSGYANMRHGSLVLSEAGIAAVKQFEISQKK